MARNIFQYALLGGIQGGAEGLARGMAEEQRFNREQQLMAEREAERRRYLEEQRGGATGTRSSGGGGAAFDPAGAEAIEKYITQDDPERIAEGIRADGGQVVKRLGSEPGDAPRYDTTSELWQSKADELRRIRKAIAFRKDYKDIAEADLTERAGDGNINAQAGLLATKGKGRSESLQGGGGVFDALGERPQELNAMGRAEASKDNAAAGESAADAKKKLRDAEDALKTGSAEKLYQQISSIRPITENMLLPKEQREQAGRVLSMLMSEVERTRGGGSGSPAAPAAPAAPQRGGASAPKPSGKAPYQEGQRLRGPDGKTYVVRNGKPVPA